jgi:hypothetical protein
LELKWVFGISNNPKNTIENLKSAANLIEMIEIDLE